MKLIKQNNYLQEEKNYYCAGISEEAQVEERVFERGQGIFLYDVDGNQYMDFAAGIFTNNTGHCHPHVVQALQQQAAKLWNVHDYATPERTALCRLLKQYLPAHLDRFCFFSTGAEAVESAIRLASSVAPPERKNIGALRYGFHGKSLAGRMLVNWQVGTFYYPGNAILGYSAYCYRCPFQLQYPACNILCAKLVVKHITAKEHVAAFIFEPILGAGGIVVPPREYWEMIGESCQKNKILMIADEILTGGGRLGTFLASQYYQLEPDLLLLAKGISSGFPFSILAGRQALINSPSFSRPGAASSTFASNPLGIAAAKATLEAMEQDSLLENVRQLAAYFNDRLQALKQKHEILGDVRGMGFLYGLEFVKDKKSKTAMPRLARQIFKHCFQAGLKTCLGGHIIRLSPPFTLDRSHLDEALQILDTAITQTAKGIE